MMHLFMVVSKILMKFELSQQLIKKLCMVNWVFIKNGVPDDVFKYVITPLFPSNTIDNVFIFDVTTKKFTSMFEYGYDFNVVLKNEWTKYGNNDIGRSLSNNAIYNLNFTNNHSGKSVLRMCGINNTHYTHMIYYNNEYSKHLHTMFSFLHDNVECHTFYVKQISEDDINVVDKVIENNLLKFSGYLIKSNLWHKKYLELLKNKYPHIKIDI
jgi:hypothetical protein